MSDNMTNNLFYYGMSELTQDAFISWLMSHAMEVHRNADPALHHCALEFLHQIFASKGIQPEDLTVTNIERQKYNIDVLVSVGRYRIIIEDKTFTNVHGRQLIRYRERLIASENIDLDDIILVFYKIQDQAYAEADADISFNRAKILKILRKFRGSTSNEIFLSYLSYLENIEEHTQAYKKYPILKWNHQQYIGFFKEVRETVLKEIPTGWSYVSNPSGGFMCLWMEQPFTGEKLERIGLQQRYCQSMYIQLEDNRIVAKIRTAETASDHRNVIRSLKDRVFEELNKRLNGDLQKRGYRFGRTITVGFIDYDYNNFEEQYLRMHTAMRDMIDAGQVIFHNIP